MRRWADLAVVAGELPLCANFGRSSISVGVTIAHRTCDRARSAFKINRDAQDVRICECDRRSGPTSDDAANTRFRPKRDLGEIARVSCSKSKADEGRFAVRIICLFHRCCRPTAPNPGFSDGAGADVGCRPNAWLPKPVLWPGLQHGRDGGRRQLCEDEEVALVDRRDALQRNIVSEVGDQRVATG